MANGSADLLSLNTVLQTIDFCMEFELKKQKAGHNNKKIFKNLIIKKSKTSLPFFVCVCVVPIKTFVKTLTLLPQLG